MDLSSGKKLQVPLPTVTYHLTKYKQSGTLPSLNLHFPSIRMTDELDGFSGLAHYRDP